VAISTHFGMGSNQEIQIDVDHQNEPGSSSNEESNVKRRGPSPEHKHSDTGMVLP